ncbi:MAG: hypothetical protein PWQ63_10 [Methanolobus sp.]|jgi:hypothetical protein|nr:hypothetical protein [Methanolobus sp.]
MKTIDELRNDSLVQEYAAVKDNPELYQYIADHNSMMRALVDTAYAIVGTAA